MIYGNCQAIPLRQILSRSKSFSSKFELVGLHLKPVHLLTNEDWDELKSLLESVDLFIYQNAAERFGIFGTNNLLTYLKPSCIKLAYPSLFFKGYNPETVFLSNVNFRPNRFVNYDDLNFVRVYITYGISGIAIMRKHVCAPDFYDEEFFHHNFRESIGELQKREGICNVIISDFIENNWRSQRLFFSVNHPSNIVLNELANRILKYLAMPCLTPLELFENQFLGGIILPIYHSICRQLGFGFDNSVKIGNLWFSLEDYIEKSINEYMLVEHSAIVESFNMFVRAESACLKKIATRREIRPCN